jgi:hypothetical protein
VRDVLGMHVRAGAVGREDMLLMSPRRSPAHPAPALRPLRFLKEAEHNMALQNLWGRPRK